MYRPNIKCNGKFIYIGNKQHNTNISGSIHQKLRDTEPELKKALYIKRACILFWWLSLPIIRDALFLRIVVYMSISSDFLFFSKGSLHINLILCLFLVLGVKNTEYGSIF